jgi:hypothetical protein
MADNLIEIYELGQFICPHPRAGCTKANRLKLNAR